MPDYENFDKMDAAPSREEEAAEPRRRPTVHVTNSTGRSITLNLHQVVADDGAGRAFLGRMPDSVVVNGGGNAGVDKQFFDAWYKQNQVMADQMGIAAVDEDDPDELADRERKHQELTHERVEQNQE